MAFSIIGLKEWAKTNILGKSNLNPLNILKVSRGNSASKLS